MIFHFRLFSIAFLITAFFAAGCATTAPVPKPKKKVQSPKEYKKSGAGPDESARLRDDAQRARNQQKLIKAYKEMTEEFPRGKDSGFAWFRLGQHYMNIRDYRSALNAFEKVVTYFSDEPYYFESYINVGISLVYLKRHSQAEDVLRKAYAKASSKRGMSTILYHLGENAYLLSDFKKAVRWFIAAIDINGSFRRQAERRIRLIFHNFLSEEDLYLFAMRYKTKFPADVAYLELIQIYKRNADYISLDDIRKEANAAFPGLEAEKKELEVTAAPEGAITIGGIFPLTGKDAGKGSDALRGVQLAFSINDTVVSKNNVRLSIKDSQSLLSGAAKVAKEFGQDSSVVSVVGPFSGDRLLAVSRELSRHGIPVFSQGELSGIQGNTVFPIGVSGKHQAEIISELAVDNFGFYRVAILYPQDEYGRSIMRSFQESMNLLGAKVVVSESYHPEATDFGAQIKKMGGISDSKIRDIIYKMVEENEEITPEEINETLEMKYQNGLTIPYIVKYRELPLTPDNFSIGLRVSYDALYIPGKYNVAGLILPELAFYNISAPQVFGSDLYLSQSLLSIAKRHAEGVIFPVEFYVGSERFFVRRFVENFENAFGVKPGLEAARAFDAVSLILSAIGNGAYNRAKIAERIGNMETYLGVSGGYSGAGGGVLEKSPFFMTVKKGKLIEYNPLKAELRQ